MKIVIAFGRTDVVCVGLAGSMPVVTAKLGRSKAAYRNWLLTSQGGFDSHRPNNLIDKTMEKEIY